jgi:rubredoxin
MSWWICDECNYVLEAEAPPEKCPQCKQVCIFSDVTCYIPECGGPGSLDPKLVAAKIREARQHK